MNLKRGLARFARARDGSVAVEAALLLPLGIFTALGAWELYSYYRALAVVDRAAFLIANSVAMQRELKDLTTCTAANVVCTYNTLAPDLLEPLDYQNNGALVISLFVTEDATQSDGATEPEWKTTPEWRKLYHGGNASAVSSALTPPTGFPLAASDDHLVAVEVFYNYTPFAITSGFWQSLGGSKTIVGRAFFRPRFSNLTTLSSS